MTVSLRSDSCRLRLIAHGAVQGVGFRPFVYRLAHSLGLVGRVLNTPSGVRIEVEGPPEQLDQFRSRLISSKPTHAIIASVEVTHLDPIGYQDFTIGESEPGELELLVVPDLAACQACVHELLDPNDRRYRYPFINCTNCGPRYSIIESMPYDRARTSMRHFPMCDACRSEYRQPTDRRFHAEPLACPACGPQIELLDPTGRRLARRDDALAQTVAALREGQIVALKGLGGFQLLVDASAEAAVTRLRERKQRDEKPFAVLVASLGDARTEAALGVVEQRVLTSPECPILLCRRRGSAIVEQVAPANPLIGILLPPTPLHQLLARDFGRPLVATSGNRSREPICIDNAEALQRLGSIADLFLVHDRPILRHVDDSVVRVVRGREMVLRRARGFAPLPLPLPDVGDTRCVAAFGGQLKNAPALAIGNNAFLLPHVGDLESPLAVNTARASIESAEALFGRTVEAVVCDLHPDYASTRLAVERHANPITVQHHVAHALSAMAENELEPPVLAVVWDGAGLGLDRTIWGGEFILVTSDDVERVAHLRPFRLPGAEVAQREGRRSALGLLHAAFGEAVHAWTDLPPVAAISNSEHTILARMLSEGRGAPWTTSAGRLFDAVAAMADLRQVASFEGQAAMMLEFACEESTGGVAPYCFELSPPDEKGPIVIDWEPMLEALIGDVRAKLPAALISRRFHDGLALMIARVAHRVGTNQVALTGGCFQNAILVTGTSEQLEANGHRVYLHQRVPPGDGGLALGQLLAARRSLNR